MSASEKQVKLLEQERTQVEQLRREAAVTRSKGILRSNYIISIAICIKKSTINPCLEFIIRNIFLDDVENLEF